MEQAEQSARPEVADEVVIPEAREVDALIVASAEFVRFREGMAAMFKAAHGVVFDLTKTRDNAAARQLRKQLVSTRTAIEQARLDGNRADRESVAKSIATREEIAAKLTEAVRKLEEPIDAAIRADEERREREREEARQREEQRIAGHIASLGRIKEVAERAVDAPVAEIEAKLALVGRMEIGEDWEEFQARALQTKADVLTRLTELLERARRQEAERQAAEANARELERLRAAEREREQREAAERAAREREEAQRRAAEEEARKQRERVAAAVRDVIDRIQAKQVEALKATSSELVGIIEAVKAIEPGMDCGELDGQWQYARDSAIERLNEAYTQKFEAELAAAEQARIAARNRQIDENMRQFNVVQFQGTHDEIDQITAALATINAIEITAEAFGDRVELAQQLKDGLSVRLELKLNKAREDVPPPPPPAPEPAETPVAIAAPEVATGETKVPEGGTEVASGGTDGPGSEAEAPSSDANAAHYRTEIQQMHSGLLAAVALVCREAELDTRRGAKNRYLIDGQVLDEIRNVLTAVELPGGMHYTADGVLRNPDGSVHILEETM